MANPLLRALRVMRAECGASNIERLSMIVLPQLARAGQLLFIVTVRGETLDGGLLSPYCCKQTGRRKKYNFRDGSREVGRWMGERGTVESLRKKNFRVVRSALQLAQCRHTRNLAGRPVI